jgi:hypothetical protein
VFGGCNKDYDFKSIHHLDLKSLKWKEIKSNDFSLQDTSGTVFSSTFVHKDTLLFYGGIFKEKSFTSSNEVMEDISGLKFQKKSSNIQYDSNDIPNDTVLLILSFLDKQSLCSLSKVSKKWNLSILSCDDSIWKPYYDAHIKYLMDGFPKIDKSAKKNFKSTFANNLKLVHIHYSKVLLKEPKKYIESTSLELNKKFVFIGDSNVGKTSLLMTYAYNAFPIEYTPTIFDNCSFKVRINNKTINLGL